MSEQTTVVLVDDQSLLRRGLRMVLDAEDDLRVVGEAGTGGEAVTLVGRTRPDVVLMDVRMPGMDGIEATGLIAAAQPASRVLVLTTFDLDEYAFGALRAGASGFLLKSAPPDELIAAIRVIAAGEAVISARITRAVLDRFAARLPAGGVADDRLGRLTEREREVFLAVARGLSNAELAQRFVVSESTVKSHVGSVLHKLALRDRVQAVILAYELGLV